MLAIHKLVVARNKIGRADSEITRNIESTDRHILEIINLIYIPVFFHYTLPSRPTGGAEC